MYYRLLLDITYPYDRNIGYINISPTHIQYCIVSPKKYIIKIIMTIKITVTIVIIKLVKIMNTRIYSKNEIVIMYIYI